MVVSSAELGPWIRLEGISTSQLPPDGHGVKPSTQALSTEKFSDGTVAATNVKTFVTNVLSEAVPFIDGVAPKAGGSSEWRSKGSKKYSSSDAPVHLFERTIAGKDLDKIKGMSQFSADRKNETWFCRRSCHMNKAMIRTASFGEFRHSFKEHHAESERAFTPTVIGAREAMRWNTTGIEVEVHGERWENVTVAIEEMTHKIDPKPLKNRTFPVVQITGDLAGSQEFMVISIPLNDFEKSPYAEYARDKSLVVAAYTSIERIRILPTNGDIEWIMTTASDAGGVLPQWVQNLAVPSAIAKDVELFLAWISNQRGNKAKVSPIPKSENKATPSTPLHTITPPILKNGDARLDPASKGRLEKDLPTTPV